MVTWLIAFSIVYLLLPKEMGCRDKPIGHKKIIPIQTPCLINIGNIGCTPLIYWDIVCWINHNYLGSHNTLSYRPCFRKHSFGFMQHTELQANLLCTEPWLVSLIYLLRDGKIGVTLELQPSLNSELAKSCAFPSLLLVTVVPLFLCSRSPLYCMNLWMDSKNVYMTLCSCSMNILIIIFSLFVKLYVLSYLSEHQRQWLKELPCVFIPSKTPEEGWTLP